MADDIAKKLAELRQQASEKLSEARAIVSQMNTVETLFDLPLTTIGDLDVILGMPTPPLFADVSSPTADVRNSGQVQKRRTPTGIRPDEYFGDEPMEAAKKYIRGVGHAIRFDEITDAVQKGGAAIKGADWQDRLEISLKRSPYQVITVADKTYGLAEFYTAEQLKRFRGARRSESEPTAKKKAKGKPKSKAKSAAPAKKNEPTTAQDRTKQKAAAVPVVEPPSKTGESVAGEPVH